MYRVRSALPPNPMCPLTPTPGQDTQAVWFSMLETGFSFIAINLPSLWGMVSRVSIESVIRSVRSLLSLNSQSSSSSSANGPPRLGDNSSALFPGSHSLNVELVHQGGAQAKFSTKVTRSNWVDLDDDDDDDDDVRDHTARADLESGIRVQKSFSATRSKVET